MDGLPERKIGGTWPSSVFELGLLRALDERGRTEVEAAGARYALRSGDVIFEPGSTADALFVVGKGKVELLTQPRGESRNVSVRSVASGSSFGEEAAIPGAERHTTAVAREPAEVVSVPWHTLSRAVERAGGHSLFERERRLVERAFAKDALSAVTFAPGLGSVDLELLLDGAQFRRFERGEHVFDAGDEAKVAFLIVDGLVQLQSEVDGELWVRAYLDRGDLVGDEDALRAKHYSTTALGLSDLLALSIPGALLRSIADRNPGLSERLHRIARRRDRHQAELAGNAAQGSTRHVFHDVYRMQMARSLLVIDQDSCVRCGHCSWACGSLYGVTRLVRRGDIVVAQNPGAEPTLAPAPLAVAELAPETLLLPNSCQHCRNPACMIDCPTGAIGRDPEGEVFIRPDLCTGCGACAKACPWDNIQIVPRASTNGSSAVVEAPSERAGAPGISSDVAVKCDLCSSYDGPACVKACPTESIVRLEPQRDFSEIARLLGGQPGASDTRSRRRGLEPVLLGISFAVALGLVLAGYELHTRGVLSASDGVGLWAGWMAALACLGAAAYVFAKRSVRAWMRPRRRGLRASDRGRETRSLVRPHYRLHVAVGLLALGLAALHSGFRHPTSGAGALQATFTLLSALGILGVWAYSSLPARLTRLERRGELPEDLPALGRELKERLFREMSGRHAVVKAIYEHLILPYVRSPSGPIELVLSGRSLREEEARLMARIQARVGAALDDRFAGLDAIVRIAVELRALPARRTLGALLRVPVTGHVILATSLVILLALHAIGVLR